MYEDEGDYEDQPTFESAADTASTDPEQATNELDAALKAVNDALMYGRQQNGLFEKDQAAKPEEPAPEAGGIPDSEGEAPPPRRPRREQQQLRPEGNLGGGNRARPPQQGPEYQYRGGLPADLSDQESPGIRGTLERASGWLRSKLPDENPLRQYAERADSELSNPAEWGRRVMSDPMARTIMSYLQGAGAVGPDVTTALERQVDPQGILDEGTRKLLAVGAANSQGGPEASSGVVQAYRQKYDSYRGFALYALQHGDIQAAARAATQAYPNLPDGSDVRFAPAEGGVTATVTTSNGAQPQQIQLTPQQFGEWLSGAAGQFDNVLGTEGGGAAALMRLVHGQGPESGGPAAQEQGQPAQAAPRGPAYGGVNASQFADRGPNRMPGGRQDRDLTKPDKEGRFWNGTRMERINPAMMGPQNDDERAVMRDFPMAGQQGARAAANQAIRLERIKSEGKENVQLRRNEGTAANAQTRAEAQRDVAALRQRGYDDRTKSLLSVRMAQLNQSAQTSANNLQIQRERNAIRPLLAKMNAFQPLNDNERALVERIENMASSGEQPSYAPSAQQQPQPQQPTNAGRANATARWQPPDPQNWQWNAARRQYRRRDGSQIVDENGNPQ